MLILHEPPAIGGDPMLDSYCCQRDASWLGDSWEYLRLPLFEHFCYTESIIAGAMNRHLHLPSCAEGSSRRIRATETQINSAKIKQRYYATPG